MWLQVHTLQSVLQGVAAVVTQYGYLLATKTELFLQKLLHGVNAPTHFAQQVLCMNAIRAICMSPSTVHFLYTTCVYFVPRGVTAVASTEPRLQSDRN